MNLEDKKFLVWLSNRMIFKHGYSKDDLIIKKLIGLASEQIINVTDTDLDLIISKYYTDFLLDKTEDMDIGYTNTERNNIRVYVKSLVDDIVNKNVPKNTIK